VLKGFFLLITYSIDNSKGLRILVVRRYGEQRKEDFMSKKLLSPAVLFFAFLLVLWGVYSLGLADEKSVDERIAELQRLIDQKGFNWTAGRTW